MARPKRRVWWMIAILGVVVLIGVGLLAWWVYTDLLLQYD